MKLLSCVRLSGRGLKTYLLMRDPDAVGARLDYDDSDNGRYEGDEKRLQHKYGEDRRRSRARYGVDVDVDAQGVVTSCRHNLEKKPRSIYGFSSPLATTIQKKGRSLKA